MSVPTSAGASDQVQLSLNAMATLTSHSDIEQFLPSALDQAIQVTNAQAGSLLLVTDQPRLARQGDLSLEIETQISVWEDGLQDRLRTLSWQIEDGGALPLSSHVLDATQHLLVNTPLLHDDKVTGCLTLVFSPGHTLTMSQRRVLTWCARTIGNLATMVEQFTITRDSLLQLSFLHQTSQALTSTLDLGEVLDNTMELATKTLNAQASTLMLIDEETNELVFNTPHGEKREILRSYRMSMDQGIAGWVAVHGEPAIVNDAARDERFDRGADARTGFLTQSVICVPLQIKERTIGVLEALNKMSDEGFNEADLRLLSTLAAQAAIAIENARLYRSLREERDKIIRVQEEARRELARDLHDTTLQRLSSTAMSLDYVKRLLEHQPDAALEELERVQETVLQASREARILLFELRPIVLETQGLVPAIEAYIEQLQGEGPPIFHFDDGGFDGRLGEEVEATAFIILQEAINNARKHANAENIWLNFAQDDDYLRIAIEDDGRGFDLEATRSNADQGGHLGLVSMRERAELIEADLTIHSRPRGGTEIVLRLPASGQTDQS
jgi:signal transduction histidine kinase